MASSDAVCADLLPLLFSFVDAFVDFSVSGIFFPVHLNPSPNPEPAAATCIPAPSRLLAIGDLHGDFYKSFQALSLCGLVDPSSVRWTGQYAVVVQVGDDLDRGDDELRLLYHLYRLKVEASRAGGALHILHGNHEIMNAQGDFSYVTRAGLDEFKRWAFWYRSGVSIKRLCAGLDSPRDPFKGIPKSFPGIKEEFWEGFRARIAALRPSGPIAVRFLAGNQKVLVMAARRSRARKINEEVREWIMGLSGGRSPPPCLRGLEVVVCLRLFSRSNCDCSHLEEVVAMIT